MSGGHTNTPEKVFMQPGYICHARSETLFHGVVGAGIIVTMYDPDIRVGGMCYFIKSRRKKPSHDNAFYAFPSISGLLGLFEQHGSHSKRLEVHVYGGADNPLARGHIHGMARENVRAAKHILEEKKIKTVSFDIGGRRGRKIVFNSKTGEVIVAKVTDIRGVDWYPEVKMKKTGR